MGSILRLDEMVGWHGQLDKDTAVELQEVQKPEDRTKFRSLFSIPVLAVLGRHEERMEERKGSDWNSRSILKVSGSAHR